jgi:hypothetical protein
MAKDVKTQEDGNPIAHQSEERDKSAVKESPLANIEGEQQLHIKAKKH